MKTKKEMVVMLGNVALFGGFSKRELNSIQSFGKQVTHPKGKNLAVEGEPGVAFHLILSGRASVFVRGRKRTTLGAGDSFGEVSLIDGGPRTATVTAESDVETLSIAAWDFKSLLHRSPLMSRKLLLQLCRFLRDARSEPA